MTENVKPNYIYADAEEKYVKAVVLYGTDGQGPLYYDLNSEHVVDGNDVENFCLKGLIIYDHAEGRYYMPTTFCNSGTNCTVETKTGSYTCPISTEE